MLRKDLIWIVLRILYASVVIIGISYYPLENSNLDWVGCGLISIATGIAIFLWLMNLGRHVSVDWSEPFSIKKPFYPMNRHPVQYWTLTSIIVMLGGVAALVKMLALEGEHFVFGTNCIFLGLAILIALIAVKKIQFRTDVT